MAHEPDQHDELLTAEKPVDEEVRPDDRIDDERLDEENTLKRDYVRSVRDALDYGDRGAVYDLVEPLHPADIADLVELCDADERVELAAAITDLMSSDVIAGTQRLCPRGYDGGPAC